MERTTRPLGGTLDHDRLDLGPKASDPATLELPGSADRIAVLVDRRHQFVDALASLGDGRQDRWRPRGTERAVADQLLQIANHFGRPREVRLVHHEDVGDLEDAGFDDLNG